MYRIDSFTELKKYHQLDGVILMTILEYSIRNIVFKKYKSVENFDIFIDYENGFIDIWRNSIVIGISEIKESSKEIDISLAKYIEYDLKIGEEVTEQYSLAILDSKYILNFKKNFTLKSKEYYNIIKYNMYTYKIGDLINGLVFSGKRDLIIRDNNYIDMLLPKQEQMFNDFIRKKERILTVIKRITWEDNQPIIILSRNVPNFIQKLLEKEIPDILDGFVIVKQVVRIPGEKSKVSVESSDFQIEPVPACLGKKGIRIHSIIKELKTENIDIIKYSNNIQLYILRAFSPTKICLIEIDEQNKIAMISLKYEQIVKAIKNIRLAEKLTGYKIYIIRYYYFLCHKNEEKISIFNNFKLCIK